MAKLSPHDKFCKSYFISKIKNCGDNFTQNGEVLFLDLTFKIYNLGKTLDGKALSLILISVFCLVLKGPQKRPRVWFKTKLAKHWPSVGINFPKLVLELAKVSP